MPLAQKVVIKDVVFFASEGGVGVAPRGEYDMAECGDCRLEFCSCDGGQKKFTLSLDAVRQHLSEGRMAVVAAARRA